MVSSWLGSCGCGLDGLSTAFRPGIWSATSLVDSENPAVTVETYGRARYYTFGHLTFSNLNLYPDTLRSLHLTQQVAHIHEKPPVKPEDKAVNVSL